MAGAVARVVAVVQHDLLFAHSHAVLCGDKYGIRTAPCGYQIKVALLLNVARVEKLQRVAFDNCTAREHTVRTAGCILEINVVSALEKAQPFWQG